jgi:hypothetical protein
LTFKYQRLEDLVEAIGCQTNKYARIAGMAAAIFKLLLIVLIFS